MINLLNIGELSQSRRHETVLRAIHSQPYFYRFNFPIVAGLPPETQVSQNIGINRDFYLTEIQGNFGEAYVATDTLFQISVWTNYLRSVYRYSASAKLDTAFVDYEARFRVPVVQEVFCDRQFEYQPIHIRNSDKVFCEIVNLEEKTNNLDIDVILKGFSLISNVYVTPAETQQINDSINRPVTPEFLRFTVEETGKKTFVVTNDNQPRLILGFGAINADSEKTLVPQATVSIQDLSRRLNLTDRAIPLEFIAPRLTCLLDAHRYWLPVEYYFPPYGKLAFDVDTTFVQDGGGFEFTILTRTV